MDVHVIKTVPITFKMVVDAYQKVRQGGKAVGIDEQSWRDFERNAEKNLYVIWNRLASGSYHPMAVKEVAIPKKDGKVRKLGIPTLRDRIAQRVVKDYLEKQIDQKFHSNSYGYRPLKSSKQAIEEVRKNCIKQDWVIDLDIAKFFDEIDHELLMKAVEAMTQERWVRMYVNRWLDMKIEDAKGRQHDRKGKGTPQGGVISPLLANIFLHYALDKWLEKYYPQIHFVRYADDMVVHCHTKQEAETLLKAIEARLKEVKLQLNEKKTQIVYCKDYRREEKYDKVQFGFLGFSYQPRKAKSKHSAGKSYTAFTAEISKENQRNIRQEIRQTLNWQNTRMEIADIAAKLNPKLRGWINYFGLYGKEKLRLALKHLDDRLIKWIRAKHKITGLKKAITMLTAMMSVKPKLFYHWQTGYSFIIKK